MSSPPPLPSPLHPPPHSSPSPSPPSDVRRPSFPLYRARSTHSRLSFRRFILLLVRAGVVSPCTRVWRRWARCAVGERVTRARLPPLPPSRWWPLLWLCARNLIIIIAGGEGEVGRVYDNKEADRLLALRSRYKLPTTRARVSLSLSRWITNERGGAHAPQRNDRLKSFVVSCVSSFSSTYLSPCSFSGNPGNQLHG